VELKSLYREPEQRDELSFGALELNDVFKIYRSGPAETVALRGLSLRVEERELVGLRQEHSAASLGGAGGAVGG
jgi:hypothetical protein